MRFAQALLLPRRRPRHRGQYPRLLLLLHGTPDTGGGGACEKSDNGTVADGAWGKVTGKDFGDATVADIGTCGCGTDDAAGRGVREDSGVIPVDGVDGWSHTSKPRGTAGPIPRSLVALAVA